MPLQLVNELDDATHYLPDTEEVFRRRYRAASYLVHHSACACGAETREHLQLYVPYARSMFVTKKRPCSLVLFVLCVSCVSLLTQCVCLLDTPRVVSKKHTRTTRDATRHLVPLATHPPAFPCLAPPAPSHMACHVIYVRVLHVRLVSVWVCACVWKQASVEQA